MIEDGMASAAARHPEEARSAVSKDEAEKGMAQMSAKFKEMGSNVYLDAEKVKESNRVL
jgi:phosphomethylpyrimidine synthase